MYDDCEATAQRKGILPFLFAFGEGKYFFSHSFIMSEHNVMKNVPWMAAFVADK